MSVFSVSTYAKPIKGLRRRRTRFLGLSGPYALYGDQLDRARTALTLWKLANRRPRCHRQPGCRGGTSVGDLRVRFVVSSPS